MPPVPCFHIRNFFSPVQLIMRKSILTLGIAAVLTGVLATCSMTYAADDELAQIQESGKLKVGVEGTYPPYTYHDDNGELTGFDVEVAKAIDRLH